MLAVCVAIVPTGVVGLLIWGLPEAAVNAASGVVIGLVQRLAYGELRETRREIERATDLLKALGTDL